MWERGRESEKIQEVARHMVMNVGVNFEFQRFRYFIDNEFNTILIEILMIPWVGKTEKHKRNKRSRYDNPLKTS